MTSERNFQKLLKDRWQKNYFVSVGLDPDFEKIPSVIKEDPQYKGKPGEILLAFGKAIVDLTADLVCAFKPQSSFYEAWGEEGIWALKETVGYIHQKAPEIPVILDAKRADIGSTNEGYVKAILENLEMDAVTLQPYLGGEALAPFLQQEDRGLIVLCRTSNPGAGEFQDLLIQLSEEEKNDLVNGPFGSAGSQTLQKNELPLYQYVALRVVNHWNKNNNCCLVIGATYPEEAQEIRNLVGDIPFLIPGVGAQGGDVKAIVQAAKDSQNQGMIINSARGIIFASSGEDFAEAARVETQKLTELINQYR